MFVAHVGHATPPPARLWFAIAVVAGLLAALVMNLSMATLSTGYVPATVATSILQGTLPSQVSRRSVVLVHHAFGPLVGSVYAALGVGLDLGLPAIARVAGLSMAAHIVASLLVVVGIYGVFAWVVLPRYGGEARDRVAVVRRHWLASTAVFGLTVALTVPLLLSVVR
jgi:hypothetical protein